MSGEYLGRVLAPTTGAEFFAGAFERAPLHVARNDPAYFADVYGIADVEDALVTGSREPEQFLMVRAGGDMAAPRELSLERPSVRWRTTGKPGRAMLDPHSVSTYLDQGYTLIVKDAALFSARLQRFSNGLQHDLQSYAQVNVYLTPGGAQGFESHHDTHDTLTIQCAGEKTWRIYEPVVELPLETQPFHSGTKMPNLRVLREITLRAGDTLYIPRGFPHEARSAAETSLHATFALMPVRAIDLLEAVIRIAADNDVELRRTFAPDWTSAPDFAERFAAAIAPRLAEALAPERVRFAREAVLDEQFTLTRADAAGSVEQVERLRNLLPQTTLRLREGAAFMVRERAKTVDLLVAGKSLAFPMFCKVSLERLVAGPVTFAELDPALSEKNRMVLVRTLVLDGFVTIDAAGDAP